jgi:hypothetical protein
MDGLAAALNEITNERQQALRERNRGLQYAPGLVWELSHPYGGFPAGVWVEAPLIAESVLERLCRAKMVRPVTSQELSDDSSGGPSEVVPVYSLP